MIYDRNVKIYNWFSRKHTEIAICDSVTECSNHKIIIGCSKWDQKCNWNRKWKPFFGANHVCECVYEFRIVSQQLATFIGGKWFIAGFSIEFYEIVRFRLACLKNVLLCFFQSEEKKNEKPNMKMKAAQIWIENFRHQCSSNEKRINDVH